ncbi:MAG: hypothetical protein ACKVZJ_11955 [Phycisphaerales bacterium]
MGRRIAVHSVTVVGRYELRALESVRVSIGEEGIRAFRQRIFEFAYEVRDSRTDQAPITVRNALLLQLLHARVRTFRRVQFSTLRIAASIRGRTLPLLYVFWVDPTSPKVVLIRAIRPDAWTDRARLWVALRNPPAWKFGRLAWVMTEAHETLTSTRDFQETRNRQSGNP